MSRIIEHEVTSDGRGIHGKWVCAKCSHSKNSFDTLRKKVDATCAKCGNEVVLDVEGYLLGRCMCLPGYPCICGA